MAKRVTCPNCGCVEAVLLLNYHCPNRSCKFWSPFCPDCEIKLVLTEICWECPDCGYEAR